MLSLACLRSRYPAGSFGMDYPPVKTHQGWWRKCATGGPPSGIRPCGRRHGPLMLAWTLAVTAIRPMGQDRFAWMEREVFRVLAGGTAHGIGTGPSPPPHDPPIRRPTAERPRRLPPCSHAGRGGTALLRSSHLPDVGSDPPDDVVELILGDDVLAAAGAGSECLNRFHRQTPLPSAPRQVELGRPEYRGP